MKSLNFSHQTIEHFFSQARNLRTEFDQRMGNPLESRNERFVWDFWHVPKQYTLLRTPAHAFFTRKLYHSFHRHLVEWGRANLGCHDVSPPWLSCYVEGCRQERHQDVPHGPLAFVFSLSKGSKFRGGETFVKGFSDIKPVFNRLLVFNPALPHGVRKVKGTMDPCAGRLVIHGWFVNPRPFWYGPLTAHDVKESIDTGLGRALTGQLRLGRGFISLRLKISRKGEVAAVSTVVNTLSGAGTRDLDKLVADVKGLRFAAKHASTNLTLPLLIE